MFKILYGDVNPFDGLAPTPLVSRDVSVVHFGRKNHDVDTFVLNGVLTGLCEAPEGGDFEFFWNRVKQLHSGFAKPFQKFSIIEDIGSGTGIIFEGRYAIPRSIDVDESPFATLVPFSVTVDVYDESRFSGAFGVLDPDQEFQFSAEDDGTVTLTKTTSARAFNTDVSSLERAADFVNSRTGIAGLISPLFIPTSGSGNSVLVSLNKTVDRLTGTYSVDESWVYDLYGRVGASCLHQMTTSIEAGDIGVQVSIEGNVLGGINTTIQQVRDDYNAIDYFGEAQTVYTDFGYTGTLYTSPIRRTVSENTNDKSIAFSMQFNDSIAEDPYIIDSLSVSWDSQSNKHCANASVSIRSTDSCLASKWVKVNDFYSSFDITQWIGERLTALGYNLILPSKARSESVSFNQKAGTINLTASICEKKILVPENFADFNYTIQVSPAMPIFVPFQGLDCGGAHTVQKLLGKTRKVLTIQGEGTLLPCASKAAGEASMREYIDGVKLVHLSLNDTFLSASSVRFGNGSNDKKIYFSFSWNENDELIFDEENLHSSLV